MVNGEKGGDENSRDRIREVSRLDRSMLCSILVRSKNRLVRMRDTISRRQKTKSKLSHSARIEEEGEIREGENPRVSCWPSRSSRRTRSDGALTRQCRPRNLYRQNNNRTKYLPVWEIVSTRVWTDLFSFLRHTQTHTRTHVQYFLLYFFFIHALYISRFIPTWVIPLQINTCSSLAFRHSVFLSPRNLEIHVIFFSYIFTFN